MATREATMRAVCVASLLISISFAKTASAQRFSDPAFRTYPLRVVDPTVIENSLRRFLSDKMSSGEDIEIVSDQRAGRLLVRGSDEVQRLTDQFIQATDVPVAQAPQQLAQAGGTVRGYGSDNLQELTLRLESLQQRYGRRGEVRIAVDRRTRQLVVHAPQDVHQQITANWNNPSFFQVQSPPATSQPAQLQHLPTDNAAAPATQQSWMRSNQRVQLEHITWQDLLRGLRPIQGQSAAVSSPQDGTLEVTVPSQSGDPTQLRIDQQDQVVQISGSADSTKQWTRVVQALDSQPKNPGELQLTGRLGDTQPTTITRTITMLGGAGSDRVAQPLPSTTGQWGGEVVQKIFGQQPAKREPLQLAQADAGGVPAANAQVEQQGQGADEVARMLAQGGDAAGSFLGPVRIEFLEGTDIFIVRGQKRDVDRVMQIIDNIQGLTDGTEPEIEVYQLDHANSEAIAAVIEQLNTTVLQARQGDISVTALVKPNAVLLIGRAAGVEAVKKIIKELDVEAGTTDRFKIFPLDYLAAVDAERTLNYLYVQSLQNQDAAVTGLTPRVRIVADYRSNSIVVVGSQRDVDEIGDLLKQIDVEGSATISEIQVFPLKKAIAEEVANVLNDTLGTNLSQQAQAGQTQGQVGGGGGGTGSANTRAQSSNRAVMLQMRVLDAEGKRLLDDEMISSGILSNVVVSFNERTNSIVVTAPKGSMELIAEIIRQLDELPSQEAFVRVFAVVKGDASTMLDMLDTLFPQGDNQQGALLQSAAGTDESTLVPLRFALDPRTNSIVATGNKADLEVVEAILLTLDASDVSGRKTTVYEVANQQASFISTAITDFILQRRDAIQTIAPDTLSPYQLIDQEVIVVADDNTNKLIVSTTDRYHEEVMQLIRDLDKRPDMVMVKCLIARVDLDTTEEIGVELGLQDSLLFNRSSIVDGASVPGFNFNNQPLGGVATNPGSNRDHVGGQALSDLGLGRTNGTLGYGGLVLSASNESVSVLVRALQEARRLDVLSRPQVTMLNNTPGRVQVGQLVPFVGSTINTGIQTQNSVEFQEVGLTLEVTPRISPDGLIVMSVGVINSELDDQNPGVAISVSADGTVIRQPIINQTAAETFVSTRDGQTVIIGGLITKARGAIERKVPYLGDVPFFGRLFRADAVIEERSELLIILTPFIVRDETDINHANTEEFARMSWCLGNVIETHGDIMGGGTEVYREGAIYSELQGDELIETPMESDGTTTSPSDLPTATPVPGDSWMPTPNVSNPPVPGPTPDILPQASIPSVLRKGPQSAALDPAKQKPLFGKFSNLLFGNESKTSDVVSKVSPVGHVDDGVGPSPQHAILRFDQIPANESN